jgi:hypothetical protein
VTGAVADMPGKRNPVPYKSREQLAEAMRAAVLANPTVVQHDAMARALHIAPRTLYRLRNEFKVPWPPFDDWDELVRMAGTVEVGEPEPAHVRSWMVTYTVREQRWVSATTIEEAIAKLRAEVGPRAIILSVQPA